MASEIDELKAMIASAVSKIGTLEAELRGRPAPPTNPMPDFNKFKEALFLDPIGTMKEMGAGTDVIDYARDVFIADKLGDQAPPKMRILAAQGPGVIAAQKQETAIAALSRKVDDFLSDQTNASKRKEFADAITQMKDKYPNLVKAHTVAGDDIESELTSAGGSVSDFLAAQEAKWSKFGLVSPPAAAPSASANDAAKIADPSKQVDPAKASESDGATFTAEANAALIAKILAKNSAPKV